MSQCWNSTQTPHEIAKVFYLLYNEHLFYDGLHSLFVMTMYLSLFVHICQAFVLIREPKANDCIFNFVNRFREKQGNHYSNGKL